MTLIDELQKAFGDDHFDVTDLIIKAEADGSESLAEAIDDAIPRSRQAHGTFNAKRIRAALKCMRGVAVYVSSEKQWTFQVDHKKAAPKDGLIVGE